MQTFLPLPSFSESASVLDWRRLGKQRVEAKQILQILLDETSSKGWQRHPAVLMWRGYELALTNYGLVMCEEWIRRGYVDSLRQYFLARCVATSYLGQPAFNYPPFVHNPSFHLSHRSNLIRKDPVFYGPLWPGVPSDLPYMWIVSSEQANEPRESPGGRGPGL